VNETDVKARAVGKPGRVAPEWDRNTRAPVPLPPTGSCDCQFHIFGDPNKYPLRYDVTFRPPQASFADMRQVLRIMGFQRGVIVHTQRFDLDHSLLIDELTTLAPQERKNFRAIGIVRDELPDRELERLHAVGVRGVRFHLGKRWGQVHEPEAVRRSMHRIAELGWHARLHVSGSDILEWGDFFRSIKGGVMVIDHMGHLDFALGVAQPAMRWMLDRLHEENWWVKLSNGNRDSALESGWDDAVPFGRAFVAAAPDRLIWGSDWPHTGWRKQRMMNDAETVELLYRYADDDCELLRKILVSNPARLHGFED
jgi:predicted TIM-barrel fold metal-dependent hydrolase